MTIEIEKIYLDLEQLKEEYKIGKKEMIDSCVAILMQSTNNTATLALSESIAINTLAKNGVLKFE